jgi:hypothetical protein
MNQIPLSTATTLRIKQGAPFSVDGQYLEDDGVTPKSLLGVEITSQIRDKKGALISTLTCTVLDEPAGKYRLSAPAGTLNWPVGTLYWDVKDTVNGVSKLSDTLMISVVQAITRL